MNLDEAEDLADRTLAAISVTERPAMDSGSFLSHFTVHRERVASDLSGLRDHRHNGGESGFDGCWWCGHTEWPCPDARRYAEGLRHTANLYGVTS